MQRFFFVCVNHLFVILTGHLQIYQKVCEIWMIANEWVLKQYLRCARCRNHLCAISTNTWRTHTECDSCRTCTAQRTRLIWQYYILFCNASAHRHTDTPDTKQKEKNTNVPHTTHTNKHTHTHTPHTTHSRANTHTHTRTNNCFPSTIKADYAKVLVVLILWDFWLYVKQAICFRSTVKIYCVNMHTEGLFFFV
jgi:hypothetical protein